LFPSRGYHRNITILAPTRVLKQIAKAELYQTLSENGSVTP
jgi:hypothetical protein